jgi:hypothetical protein
MGVLVVINNWQSVNVLNITGKVIQPGDALQHVFAVLLFFLKNQH